MSQLTGSMFGIGTPGIYATPPYAWGVSPGGIQGFGAQPFSQQQFPQQQYGQPFSNPFMGVGFGGGQAGIGMVPLQQIAQLLQIVPQQLQQVQQLQQQQLAHLQQLLQLVPAQLQQLQQFLQTIPLLGQQGQQPWQQAGAGSGPLGFGLAPQAFGGQATGHVM